LLSVALDRVRRRGAVDTADRQPKVLHPRREHVAKNAPGFLDIEFAGLLLVLHKTVVPSPTWVWIGILECIWWKSTLAPQREHAWLEAGVGDWIDRGQAIRTDFQRGRHGLALNGCIKCSPTWDDRMQSPKSCKSDRF
jgi:hypothetical protein